MKSPYIVFFFILISSCSTTKQKTSIQENYLNEVFEIVENHSIKKDSVDFKALKKAAYKKLKYTTSIEDCYPIIQSILKGLEDRHSSFMTKDKVNQWRSTSKSYTKKELITFYGKTINTTIGYIQMKGFSSGDKISLTTYADSLQNLIKSIDNKHINGWILDLRKNNGGNCWPMLAGIGPLLGEGVCGYFINNKGERSSWYYESGASGINNKPIVKTSIKPYKLINALNPIAVLTGNKTASSGEVIVTAFHNKNYSKSFGGFTAGLTTGNKSFKLSDGSLIFLTISNYADRKGTVFGKEIHPDEKIEFSYEVMEKTNDPVIKRAIQWINEK